MNQEALTLQNDNEILQEIISFKISCRAGYLSQSSKALFICWHKGIKFRDPCFAILQNTIKNWEKENSLGRSCIEVSDMLILPLALQSNTHRFAPQTYVGRFRSLFFCLYFGWFFWFNLSTSVWLDVKEGPCWALTHCFWIVGVSTWFCRVIGGVTLDLSLFS